MCINTFLNLYLKSTRFSMVINYTISYCVTVCMLGMGCRSKSITSTSRLHTEVQVSTPLRAAAGLRWCKSHRDCLHHVATYMPWHHFPYIPTTVWRVIFGGANFCGKSEKVLRINFHDFKFHDSNPVQGHGTAQMTM